MGKSRINTLATMRRIEGRIATAVHEAHEQKQAELRREREKVTE